MTPLEQRAFRHGAIWELGPPGSGDLLILDAVVSGRARLVRPGLTLDSTIPALERAAEYRGDLQLVAVRDGSRALKSVIAVTDRHPMYYRPRPLPFDHELLLDDDGLPIVAIRLDDELGRPLRGSHHGEPRLIGNGTQEPDICRWCEDCEAFFAVSKWARHNPSWAQQLISI